ncbi:PREDICTED: alcohol dehydrogenase 2-like [Nicrophorus vespilloides]|uniref:Alcohol dehydrogenase 2-like n=1 Tax=Nicrophorus vespilloides TaxID=110193 RepID=A0ABM1M499_NICVS|nr:PREDICTED: alcohol dehydrogenase 2-like [Nicrophorus vespilloides]
MNLSGKVALITGGANGIGLEIVKRLIQANIQGITVLDLDDVSGKNIENEFGLNKIQFLTVDVRNESEFRGAFEKTISKFGHLDIVINNAGICNDQKVDETIDVNAKACMKGMLLGFEFMGKNKSGTGGIIINTSSIVGIHPTFALPLYSATKNFIVCLTRCYGQPFYYDLTGVKVMTVAPGATETRIFQEFGYSKDFEGLPEFSLSTSPNITVQTTEIVGDVFMNILKEGNNGSVWIINNSKPAYEEKNLPVFIENLPM